MKDKKTAKFLVAIYVTLISSIPHETFCYTQLGKVKYGNINVKKASIKGALVQTIFRIETNSIERKGITKALANYLQRSLCRYNIEVERMFICHLVKYPNP